MKRTSIEESARAARSTAGRALSGLWRRIAGLSLVWKICLGAAAGLFIWYLFCLPSDLFEGTSYSTVVNDRRGDLLGARIADDGQWRFPPCDSVPHKYKTALIQFEDKYFKLHPGVNPIAIGRALVQNLKAGHIESGGSTITMQVVRMSRGKERNIRQKIIEAILATRLELRYSKNRILALYASHAPFGGNVVGLEAASWRYFSRPPEDLSWAEAATLAVLPNSPSGIHPGKNREKLLEKRNRLIEALYRKGKLDSLDMVLAISEPLTAEPHPLPSYASHLVDGYYLSDKGKTISTTIDLSLQRSVENVTDRWNRELSRTGTDDLSAVVIDVHTGEVISYVGNASAQRKREGFQVDIAKSPRSTGSILKPILYCALLQDGEILPKTLIPDTPLNIGGFTPQNFNMQYAGAVQADQALARSLNVPAVHMLRQFGVQKFLGILKEAGMTTLTRDASDYGLSLILGGAEGNLLEITGMYAALSAEYLKEEKNGKGKEGSFPLNDKVALWYTLDALSEVNRPDELDMRMVSSVRKVSWKTGTSYGYRDAWAVGVTPDYAVGVWAGNADGHGVPGLTGARTAGPVMFDIFSLLKPSQEKGIYREDGWFLAPPAEDGITEEVCTMSGHLAGPDCKDSSEGTMTMLLPSSASGTDPCPYHKTVEGEVRFLLPPAMEWYYRQYHPEYVPSSGVKGNLKAMEFIYPENGSTVVIPRQMDGSVRGIVLNLAHRDPSTTVYWYLDDRYIGQTRHIHELRVNPEPGRHTLSVTDQKGQTLSIVFTVSENNGNGHLLR